MSRCGGCEAGGACGEDGTGDLDWGDVGVVAAGCVGDEGDGRAWRGCRGSFTCPFTVVEASNRRCGHRLRGCKVREAFYLYRERSYCGQVQQLQ